MGNEMALWADMVAAVGVFLVLSLIGAIPFCFLRGGGSNSRRKGVRHQTSRSSTILSLSNCFACGVFLATCFLGLIPHIREHEQKLRARLGKEERPKKLLNLTMEGIVATSTQGTISNSQLLRSLPSSELVVVLGFLFILLIEQAVAFCQSNKKKINKGQTPRVVKTTIVDEETEEPLVMTDMNCFDSPDGDQHSHDHHDHGGHSHHAIVLDSNSLSLSSMLLLFGLSIHSIFEGLALGLQSDTGDFIRLLIAIMLHEVLCAFAFGLSLAQQKAPAGGGFLSICFLSACIPFGMCVGFLVPAAGTDADGTLLARFFLEGLAAGTFIYVGCVEMLSAELGHSHDRSGLLKAIFVALGVVAFLVISALSMAERGGEQHSGSDNAH